METGDEGEVGWRTVASLRLAERPARRRSPAGLALTAPAARLLAGLPEGVYEHQHEALAACLRGEDVCVATGTASGKSLVFFAAGLEALARDPEARVLALYPTKALGSEQTDRWREAVSVAGLGAGVARIDGSVPVAERTALLRASRVVVMTPDVVHAWLLASVGDPAVRRLLPRLKLVVVDEVHTYGGVFGSNAAFLFRRLQHAVRLCGGGVRFVCASATIAAPDRHLEQLFGRPFHLVGADRDSSPRHPVELELVRPPPKHDLLGALGALLSELASSGRRFLAFVDSRKQAEHVAAIVARQRGADDDEGPAADVIERSAVLPYRAGYEEVDRARIQARLRDGNLAGVVSTSALELGLDLSGLDTVVLVGVPGSATSFHQRIGRVGRHGPGRVVVVDAGSLLDAAVFDDPPSLLARPLAEGALYLENQRVQYIHALCLARAGGEHDQLEGGTAGPEVKSGVSWPDGFLELCRRERLGELPVDLQSMKAECGDEPNHAFPLRDVESSFKVVLKQGPVTQGCGQLSFSQVLREAYPGAVYSYVTRPLRVYRVDVRRKEVLVRREKAYSTKPTLLPTLVFPNLSPDRVFRRRRHDALVAVECALQVREAVAGYAERRGSKAQPETRYPLRGADGLVFPLPRFVRNFFSTGVVLTHPALDEESVDFGLLETLVLEAIPMLVPFERQDVAVAADRHRVSRGLFREGTRFLAFYDRTYGSLRLTGRLVETDLLARAAALAARLSASRYPGAAGTGAALARLADDAAQPADFDVPLSDEEAAGGDGIVVIAPGGLGLDLGRSNEEFVVDAVFYSPRHETLCYRGRLASTPAPPPGAGPVTDIVPVVRVSPVPGECRLASFDPATGVLVDLPPRA